MKHIICCLICLVVALSFVGCNSIKAEEDLISGTYYMAGDFEEGLRPYVWISVEDKEFSMGAGSVVSFAANGSFAIKENTLIADTQIAKFVFKITNSKTLVLIDNGDNEYFQMAENSQFVYSNNSQ